MNRGSKEQRVGVFVDVQNMYYSARNIYNAKVNFANILKEAVAGRKLVRAIAYVIKADIGEEQNFFDALKHIGYEVKAKDLQVFIGGAKKGDWDIGIAMDTIELAHKLDVIALVSGDGDYVTLVQHLQRALGCKVEVLAFGKSAAGKLKETADDFVDFDEQAPRYLIKRAERRPVHAVHTLPPPPIKETI
ncbi:NYN domain-containing protein [Candidatus Woesearchaeota archaeon]|nr:NYN domain-containing protein [Candidatus Woesearchaeota archaeon]